MITNIDVVEDVIGLLYEASVDKLISGVIDVKRPINSISEDITVNTLQLSYKRLQSCVAMVNIHVPNLVITKNGVVTNDTPNRPRLNQIADFVHNALDNRMTSRIYTSALLCNLFVEKYSSFVGFRVEVRGKNL